MTSRLGLPALALLAACGDEAEPAAYASAAPVVHSRDLSNDSSLQIAQQEAVANTKKVTEEVSRDEVAHPCFTNEVPNAALHRRQFAEAQTAAETALGKSVATTLWPALKDHEAGTITDLATDLSTKVKAWTENNMRCPDQPYYFEDEKNSAAAFVSTPNLALAPAFWSQNIDHCERAGILAAATYCNETGNCAVVSTEGDAGNRTAELLQNMVTGLCRNPEQIVNQNAAAMGTRYGWDADTYYTTDGTMVKVDGTAPVLNHPVTGTFKLLPDEPAKNCPVSNQPAALAIDEKVSLELQFNNCLPDDTKPAILTVNGKVLALQPHSSPSVDPNYTWYDCTKTKKGACTHWTDYGIDATYGNWYSKKDHL